jgi:2-methylcitrate dehydratase PrpD
MFAVAEPAHSATERLAQHLARPIPDALRARARLHLLDWLGCVAGARRSNVAEVARAAEPDSLTRAALLGNVLEMDDVHRSAILHPGPVVWPSVLSAVRESASDMETLLNGAVRGYEAVIAIGETFDAYHYARWHNSSTAGGFGAAAAAASVFGLDQTQTSWALGNVGSISGGFWHMRHSPGAMTKQLHIAHAALGGLWVARLARRGFVGPSEILEGPQGLYAAMTEQPAPLLLSEGWRMDEVSFKPWAACRHAHPAIDAALQLKNQGVLAGPVVVETYSDAITFCDRPSPATVIDAKFSIQHALAVVAVRGEPRLEDFEPEAINHPELAAMRALIEVREAQDITARYPAHFGARVSAGGSTLDLIDTLGDPERPLDDEGVTGKARQLVAWGGLSDLDSDRAVDIALHGNNAVPLLHLLEEWL